MNLNKNFKKIRVFDNLYRHLLGYLSKNDILLASRLKYFATFHKKINLKNPRTFNEKLMYLKIYDDSDLKSLCADKVEVRKYLMEKNLEEYLIDLIGVYDSVDEIDFDSLPNTFVIKCNHGSGCNLICTNKNDFNKKQAIIKINEWMETDYSLKSAEPHYSRIKPKIIIEKFLGEKNGVWPLDYKIHCFNGEPKMFEVVSGRESDDTRFVMYNLNWDIEDYTKDALLVKEVVKKPDSIDEMITLSRVLSSDFKYVRVDLYEYMGNVYFGELTFTPAGCVGTGFTAKGELEFGNMLRLE